ncbi:hypothetical protein D3C79_730770 [compost metagenome]
MAGTPATVGNDRCCLLHDRFPIRVGHVGDQYVARFDAIHFADIVDDLHRACPNAMANSSPFHQHGAVTVQLVAFHHLLIGAHGFWPRLDYQQLAGVAVFGPLDIHRAAVVFFNQQRLMRQCLNFIIGQRETIALLFWHILDTDLLAMIL